MKLSKRKLIEKLQKIRGSSDDIEEGHIDADSLLLEYIDDENISEAYSAIEKWYA